LKYRGLDLNLLVALDALLSTRSVSRAAEKSFVTQPAMSAALRRLRDYFGDELLAAMGRRTVLTPLAEQLVEPVAELLRQVDNTILGAEQFDPARSKRSFRILVADTVLLGVLLDAFKAAAVDAPLVTFEFISPRPHGIDRLEHGEIDLLIIPSNLSLEHHPSEVLFEEGYSVIACAGNLAIAERLTVEQYCAAGHVEVAIEPHQTHLDAALLRSQDIFRRVEVTVDNFLQVPFHVSGTNRLATMPHRTAEFYQRIVPLRLFAPPLTVPPVTMVMQWHRKLVSDPAQLWLRTLVRDATPAP
jgi:LysR family nod box-dependent transcriptional activator